MLGVSSCSWTNLLLLKMAGGGASLEPFLLRWFSARKKSCRHGNAELSQLAGGRDEDHVSCSLNSSKAVIHDYMGEYYRVY